MLKNIFKIKTLYILSALLAHAPAHTMQISKTRAAGHLALRVLKNAPRTIAAHPYLSIAAVSVAATAKDLYSNYNKHARRVTQLKKEIKSLEARKKELVNNNIIHQQPRVEVPGFQPLGPLSQTFIQRNNTSIAALDIAITTKSNALAEAGFAAQAAKDQTFINFLRHVRHNPNNFTENLSFPQFGLLVGSIITPCLVAAVTGVSLPLPYLALGLSKIIGNTPVVNERLGFGITSVKLTNENVHKIAKNYLLDGSRLTMKLAGTGAVIGASLLVKAWLQERDNQAREAVEFRAQVARDTERMQKSSESLRRAAEQLQADAAAAPAPQP